MVIRRGKADVLMFNLRELASGGILNGFQRFIAVVARVNITGADRSRD